MRVMQSITKLMNLPTVIGTAMVTLGVKCVRSLGISVVLLLFTANGMPASRIPIVSPLLAIEAPLFSGEQSQEFTKWTLTQGGLLIAVLVICYMYRSDLKNLIRSMLKRIEEDREHRKILSDLIEKNTIAMTQVAASLQYLERTVEKNGGCEYHRK